MAKESIQIVIINDDPNDVNLLRGCLIDDSGQNYCFIVAKTGERGIRACLEPGSRTPDCVIVDLHLPDMSGLDVLKGLKDDRGEIQFPVVLFIDSGEECKAATAALRAGANDYIAKSWLTADGLACAVENAIERFKLRERLKKKRAALERQDREFRALVENAPDIITRFDAEFRHVYINPAIERATGLPPESFLGKTSREAGMPERLCDFWESILKEAMASQNELTFEFDFQTPAGLRCYQARLVPEFSATGEVDSVLAVSTDVTEGKRAEEALRGSEEHVRNVIDRLIAFVGVMTPAGILVEANRPALEVASLKPADVLGQPFENTYWWSYAPDVQAELRRAIECAAGGQDVRYDVLIRTGEDRFMTIDFMIAPLVDAVGKVTHLIASGVDITERKQTEEAMRKIAKRERGRAIELQTVLRATPAAIWIAKGPECRRITGNPASYKLLGIPEETNVSATSAEEVSGRAFQEFRDGVLIPPHELPMQLAASRGIESQGTEMTLRFKDGSERHLYGNATPLRKPDGTISGAISAFIDITKLKEAEEALRLSDKRKDEFLAMLAHELRNPLAAIRTAVHILLLKGPPDPELTWGRQVIERQAKHLTRLIEDLLDISRISSGKIQLKPVPLDFRDIVSRAAESVVPLMTAKQHDLKIVLPHQPLSVLADPDRLEQVVGNILTNAAKYTDNAGSITLTAAQEGPSIVVRLRDNGIGIDPEILPHVFDLYTQVNGHLARSLGGLGIGLTLVKRLVELHGGSVAAASDGPAKGSEFTILLPALDSPPGPPDKAAQGGLSCAKPIPRAWRRRVLVVDDNVDISVGLAMLIETSGYDVKTAHEGESALEVAREFRPEFVLLDIGLPGMNGYQVAQAFQKEDVLRDATLIAISGYGQNHNRERARAAGFDHHMLKPVDMEILLPILAGGARAGESAGIQNAN